MEKSMRYLVLSLLATALIATANNHEEPAGMPGNPPKEMSEKGGHGKWPEGMEPNGDKNHNDKSDKKDHKDHKKKHKREHGNKKHHGDKNHNGGHNEGDYGNKPIENK
jgi:hypothetical protein